MNIKEILVLHHSHLDVGYTHSQPIVWQHQIECLNQVLDWLEATSTLPENYRPKWTCEVTEPVRRWISQASPAQIQRFKLFVRSGRIGLAALRWHTTPLANRAGLERLLDARCEIEKIMECKIKVACQYDVTGVPWALADVLIDAGIDFYATAINIHLARAVQPRPGLFMWEAPSGRKLRVWNGNHYTMFDQVLSAWSDDVCTMEKHWKEYTKHLQEINYPYDFLFLTSTCSPVMWDNAPPNPFLPDLIRRCNESGLLPSIRYATFDDLRQRTLQIDEHQLPVLRGDWSDYWNFGCAASPIETALNQRSKLTVMAAEKLNGKANFLKNAQENIDLYDEHTFGYFNTDTGCLYGNTAEFLKKSLAYEGHEHAAFALMDSLEALSQNPVADKGIKGVLVCNPSTESISIWPELPSDWFEMNSPELERTYRTSRMNYTNRSWENSFPGANGKCFGRIDLPPQSWKAINLQHLPPAEKASQLEAVFEVDHISRREANFAPLANYQRRIGKIDSPFHTLRYDPDTGRILSLFDKLQTRNLLSPRSGMDFFSMVREHTDALVESRRYAYYQRDLDKEKLDGNCWQDWKPLHEFPQKNTLCGIKKSHHRISLQRQFEALGFMFLQQTITLNEHSPVITLDLEIELLPSDAPQAVYCVFALALQENWEAAFDSADEIIQLDVDQLPCACRNWITAESMAGMRDNEGGVALFTPEAPMVQFGDFHFHKPLDFLPRPANPLLLAWPINNYWDTNFPRKQMGRIQLRFGFYSFGANVEWVKIQQQAKKFRQPSLMWPITNNGRSCENESRRINEL